VKVDLGEPAGDPVEEPRREGLAHRVLPPPLPAGDEVEILLLQGGEEAGNLVRIVLQVAVHGDDDAALGVVESRREGRRLAEVSPQPHQLDPRVALSRLAHPAGRAVARAVVHVEDLERPSQPVQHLRHPRGELLHRLRLVAHGNDDGDLDLGRLRSGFDRDPDGDRLRACRGHRTVL